MSALRIHVPGRDVDLIDLGPCPWVPLHGRATLRGHAVAPAPEPPRVAPARTAEGQREYRARRKAAEG